MRRRRRGEKEEEEEPTKWRMARLSGWGGSKRRHPVGGSHHQTIKTIFECLKHTAGTVCSSSCTSATATIVNVHCDLWSIRADDSTGWHNFDTEQTKPYQLIWWICNRFQMIIGFFFSFSTASLGGCCTEMNTPCDHLQRRCHDNGRLSRSHTFLRQISFVEHSPLLISVSVSLNRNRFPQFRISC